MRSGPIGKVRCAIYTRVSTDQGLDQDFNSLDAQYEAASAYIRSQAHASWTLIRSRYDDGGYSGGSTDRPNLQRLLDDVRARKIDVIVVYKVDRLTRSLADFAKLVELFDAHDVSFVSVTQQFNTTTSMGRLTLNVLLSFAQFEREVTSERIRDKIAASKRKGLWVGGPLPLGYELKDGKLVVVAEEAERVRLIFLRYLEVSGTNELVRDLRAKNICTKARTYSTTGKTRGGIPFGRGALSYFLRNCSASASTSRSTRTRQPPSSISIIPALARCAGGEHGSCGPHVGAGVEVISTGTRAGTAPPPRRPWRACRRQVNSRLGANPCRRATPHTVAPACNVSSTRRTFSS